MKNAFYVSAFLLLGLLSACSEVDYSGTDIAGSKLTVQGVIHSPLTRASGTTWDNGDRIGVSVSGLSDYSSDTNIPYYYDGTDFKAEEGSAIYIKGSSEQTVIAYYPYYGEKNTEVTPAAISTASSKQTTAGQKTIDYLYATASVTRDNPSAAFSFSHVMSMLNLVFNLEDGGTKAVGTVDFTLSGLILDGTFNPQTGVVAPNENGSPTDLVLSTSGASASLILLPQTASSVKIAIEYNGKSYSGTFSTLNLSDGYKYDFQVSINGSTENPTLQITAHGINDWNPGEGGNVVVDESVTEAGATAGNPAWGAGTGGNVTSN